MRPRTRWTPDQISRLQRSFAERPFPGTDAYARLAEELGTTRDAVRVWHQNRRQRGSNVSRAKALILAASAMDLEHGRAEEAAADFALRILRCGDERGVRRCVRGAWKHLVAVDATAYLRRFEGACEVEAVLHAWGALKDVLGVDALDAKVVDA